MRVLLTVPLLVSLLQCGGDETLSGYGAAETTWRLVEINGHAFDATATIEFPEEGKIIGTGPCNTFTGAQLEPYPWFKAEKIASTRRACPELDAETAMLRNLEKMTLAEVSPSTLILSDVTGGEMVFVADR